MSGYVFVACGAAQHLARLDRSRAILRRLTERPILVVTDARRNARPLGGPEPVLDVAIPSDRSDRQAAIELKTRLPEILDREGLWCYLDTDVVAADRGVDEIFSSFAAPVTFAENLTRAGATLRRFSPYAVDCPCRVEMERLDAFFARLDELSALHRAHRDLAGLSDPAFYRAMRFRGRRRFLAWGRWWHGEATVRDAAGELRFAQTWRAGQPERTVYSFPGSPWRLVQSRPGGAESRFEHRSGVVFRFRPDDGLRGGGYWEDERGDSFRELLTGDAWWYRAGEARRRRGADPDGGGDAWFDASGNLLGECDHLAEALERDLGIAIPDRRWRAWNGGVFLFSRAARGFFAEWHRLCREIFDRPGWAARDQAALVGAAHRLELTGHPLLPRRFNRIVDPREGASRALRLADLRAREQVRFLHLLEGNPEAAELPLQSELAAWRHELGG